MKYPFVLLLANGILAAQAPVLLPYRMPVKPLPTAIISECVPRDRSYVCTANVIGSAVRFDAKGKFVPVVGHEYLLDRRVNPKQHVQEIGLVVETGRHTHWYKVR